MRAGKGTKKKRAQKRRGPRYWIIATIATGSIIAFTVGNSRAMNVAYAHRAEDLSSFNKADDGEFEKIEFKIAPGRLGDVLSQFERTTGIKVQSDNATLLDVASKGVVGHYTVAHAMVLILEGTGIRYQIIDPRNYRLTVEAEAATVEIDAGGEVVNSPKYTEPLRDIPQTINVIPKEMIEQQGATTLREVLSNVPGITFTAGEGGAPAGDNLTIRGFSARNDIYVDGVRDLGAQSRDPFNLEQVEVVKGPSSTFTGRGSTGGTINLVSKLPSLRPTYSGTLMVGNASTKRGTADINLPLGDSVAFRLNALAHDADVPGRDLVQNRRWGVAPTIAFGLTSNTRYSLGYLHLRQNNTSDYGIPWVPAANNALVEFRDRPAPVPRDTFYGFLDRDHEKLRSDMFTFRVEREFNDGMSIRNQFRYGFSKRDSMATPPRFASNDSTVINREMRSWIASDDIFDNQADITARFRTGSIQHAAVFGGSLSYEKNDRILRTAPNSQTTLFDPNPFDIYPGVITIDPRRPNVAANSQALYFFDTIKFTKRWEFVGGLRWDRFDVEGENAATVGSVPVLVPLERVDHILSGRAAIIFKPIETVSLYGSFGTSANPSLEGLLYSPADARTGPEKTRTFEIGTKWDFFHSRLLLTGAFFVVNKTDARTASVLPGEPPTLDGDQRVQGIEFSATGSVTRNWQVFTAYTFLDSEIVRSNTAPTNVNGVLISEVGKSLINTPENSFNIWSTYRFDRLIFGGGLRYIGERFGNNINTRVVDSYWTADAMASYRVSKNLDLRLNMTNLGDKYYIDRIGGGHIIPGAGRLITLSSAFNF